MEFITDIPSTPPKALKDDEPELTEPQVNLIETDPVQLQDTKNDAEVAEEISKSQDSPSSETPTHPAQDNNPSQASSDTAKPSPVPEFPNSTSAVSFMITKEDAGNSNTVYVETLEEEVLTLDKLIDLCTLNPTVQSAHFTLGLHPSKERFDFHQAVHLSNLSKISIALPKVTKMSPKEPPIPPDFRRLIYFLKQLQLENLHTIEISCTTEQAACIPLASAFVPCYEMTDYSPLADLICRNRKTLKLVTLGKSPYHQVQITLNPKECNAICEPKYYPKIETFIGIPNFPVLASWSAMLRPQRHLKRVSMAFVDAEVWNHVGEGIENSSDTVTSVNFMAFGIQSVPLDLIYFKRCISLNSFTLRYYGFTVDGWEYLPGGIKHLHLGGKVSPEDVEKMITALPLLEDVSIELKKNYFREVDGIATHSKIDVMQFPTFEFAKQAEQKLRNIHEIRFESDPDNELNFLPVTQWANQQTYFTLNLNSSHELVLSKVMKEKDETDLIFEEDDASAINEFFGSCFGGMFVYV